MSANNDSTYERIHGEGLSPTDVCPPYRHGLFPNWERAHLEHTRRVAKRVIACVWQVDARTLDIIAALCDGRWAEETLAQVEGVLSETLRLRALQRERLRSLKDTTTK